MDTQTMRIKEINDHVISVQEHRNSLDLIEFDKAITKVKSRQDSIRKVRQNSSRIQQYRSQLISQQLAQKQENVKLKQIDCLQKEIADQQKSIRKM